MNGDERLKTFKSITKQDSTLIDKNVDSGYSVSDMNLLIKEFAREQNADFFNWINVFEKTQYQPNLNQDSAVSSVVYFYDDSLDWFKMLNYYAKSKMSKEFKLVVPVIMYPKQNSGKDSHYCCISFDFRPETDTVDILLLEQHAMLDKTDKDYDEKLDYSELINYNLSALKAYCEKILGYTNVKAIRNEKPISRRKRVCGVVASELVHKLLSTKKTSDLINLSVVLSYEDIDKLHERNKKIVKNIVLKNTSKNIQQETTINTVELRSQNNQVDY